MTNMEDVGHAQPRVQILSGWHEEGREGTRLGDNVTINGMEWVPVLWDGEDDPEWHKAAGLSGQRPRLEIVLERVPGCSLNVRVSHDARRLLELEAAVGERRRAIVFPLNYVISLVATMLRKSGVSTFRWSAKTERTQVSMHKGYCASSVSYYG